MDGDLDDSMNEEIPAFDNANIGCQETARVLGQLVSPVGRGSGPNVRKIRMLYAADGARELHSPNDRDNPPDNSKRSAAVGWSGSLHG